MAANNDKGKRGFSGLSDLASEVSGIDEPLSSEPQTGEKIPLGPQAQPSSPKEHPRSDPKKKLNDSPPLLDPLWGPGFFPLFSKINKKLIFGIIGVFIVIGLANNKGEMNKKPSNNPPSSSQSHSYPQSTPAPAVQTPSATQSAGLQYTKPSVGTNNVLTVPEIRWCTREGIRIEAMRDVIDTDAGIDEFNRIVSDYNSRCGSYRYRQDSRSRAKRDVETYLSQIVSEAIRDARQLEGKNQSSLPSVSLGASTSSSPKRPSAQYTREAQQLLTDLGYDPGPVDGVYGRRTAAAVKAFQRDMKLTQDGWVDQNLLSTLRRAKAAYKPSVSQPKPQQPSLQPRSSTPSAATTAKPENLSFEEQSMYDAAQRLRRLGYDVDWRTSSLTDMLDAEFRIGTANRLARLGYNVDWRTSSLTDMLDAEFRIGTANRLAQLGYNVDWRNYSLTQLLNMEYGQN